MIDLVPLSEFSNRISDGWLMVRGYPLNPGDYAVTMKSPDHDAVEAERYRQQLIVELASKGGKATHQGRCKA